MNNKQKLFEEVLFELKNSSTEYTLVPKHPKLKRTIFGLVLALSRRDSFEEKELLGSAVSIAWEALDSFVLTDDADWNEVIEGVDRLNLNRIVKAIVTKIEHALPAIANPNTRRMYDPETGGKVFVSVNFDSLDRPLYDTTGEFTGLLGDNVSESFFSQDNNYVKNPFIEWFRENRSEFLTARQNEFIDGLSTGLLKKDSDYIDVNDLEEFAGMKTHDLDRMKKRIKKRTLDAWEKYRQKSPESSRRGAFIAEQIAQWSEFLALVDSDKHLENQNLLLSTWILRHQFAVDFIYDALEHDEELTKGFVAFLKGERIDIPACVLYEIYVLVVAEVVHLKRSLSAAGNNITRDFTNHERRKINAERIKKYTEFTKVQPCFSYNANGELEKMYTPNHKEYKILDLDAYGNLINKNDF